MNIVRITAIVVAASPLFACATELSPAGEPASSEVSAAETPATRSPCPSDAPRPGSKCSDADLLCSYGSDTRFGCRDILSCQSSAWVSVGDSCNKKVPSCSAKAPTARGDGGLDTCTAADLGITCVYDHEAYTCAPCQGNLCRAENYWLTTALPTGCPATEPNFGQKCTAAAGTRCNYNFCASDGADDLGAEMTCTSGIWTAYTSQICF